MKYIHINKHKIGSNKKNGKNEPVIAVKTSKSGKAVYCHEVEISGPSKVIYSGNNKPVLPCGARVVIVTESEVTPVLDGKKLAAIK